MTIKTTVEFNEWLSGLSEHLRALLRDRLDRIRESGHFGDAKNLGQGLFELRWKNGLRAYFSYMRSEDGRLVLMLFGGDKNGQNHDIRKARTLLAREAA